MSPLLPVEPTELDKKAHAFLTEHSDVWSLFCRFAFELIGTGRDHGGAKAIAERLRWEVATSAHYAGNEFVINNTDVASFARIFAATFPPYSTFFRTRKRPTERKAA
jgi:hypothetical protein